MRCGVLRADRVIVNKGRREMLLLRGESILRSYRVALGSDPHGHKEREGVVSRRRESVVLYEKMRAGPSESPCGRRLQTARSCSSQKLRW